VSLAPAPAGAAKLRGVGVDRVVRIVGFCLVLQLPGCGGDDSTAVPVDSIPSDKKLIELSGDEQQGVCQWVTDLASQKLAGANCHGNAITFNSCSFPTSAQVNCTATLGQWRACIPNFMDQIAQDPCQVLNLAFSQSELEAYVNAIPGCEGLGPCAYTIH
jgi:hypothetical protein